MKIMTLLWISTALGLAQPQIVFEPDRNQSTQQTSSTTIRGRGVWVFRSVLDTKPRMLVLALAPNLWAAYKTQDGSLAKIWRGGVSFSGTINDGKHGPQPVSRGPALLDRLEDSRENWQVLQNGEPVKYRVQYGGHKLVNEHVVLMTKLILDDGTAITVEEQPETTITRWGSTGTKSATFTTLPIPGLERVFTVSGANGYTVKTWINSGHLLSGNDWQVPASAYQKVERKETYTTAGTIVQEQGWLTLTSAEPTKVYHYYQAQ